MVSKALCLNDVVQQETLRLLACHDFAVDVKSDDALQRVLLCVTNTDVVHAKRVPLHACGFPVHAVAVARVCPSVEDVFSASDINAANAVLEGNMDTLCSIPGVVAVAVGIRSERGFLFLNDERPVIKLFVNKTGPLSSFTPFVLLQSTPLCVEVLCDAITPLTSPFQRLVDDQGRYMATQVMMDCNERLIGSGVCTARSDIPNMRSEVGTVCCFAELAMTRGGLGFVTCAHVLKEPTTTVYPSNAPSRNASPTVCLDHALGNSVGGAFIWTKDPNSIDCDYAFVLDGRWSKKKARKALRKAYAAKSRVVGTDADWKMMDTERIGLSGRIAVSVPPGTLVFKLGITTGLTPGVVQRHMVTSTTNRLPRIPVAPFAKWTCFADRGDSGSMVFTESGDVVGMVGFLERDQKTCLVIPMQEVLERLNVNASFMW